jgi:hypothetical protein
MAVQYIAIWGIVSIVASLSAGAIAAWKNRHVSYWMGWCFIVPPMIIALLLIPALKAPRHQPPSNDDDDSA